jgi:signal transduction histidine kinase
MSQLISSILPAYAPAGNLQAFCHAGHAVRFYADDFTFLGELAGFVHNALNSDGAFVMAATQQHCRMIRNFFHDNGWELNSERFLLLDAEDTLSRFMIDGEPDWQRFQPLIAGTLAEARKASPTQSVGVFGEMVAVLWEAGKKQAAIHLEELWNQLAKVETFSLLCAYPAKLFQDAGDSEAFAEVCGAHSAVIPDESYTSLTSENERLRAIASLQQRVRALDAQLGKHKEVETNLQSLVRARSQEIEQTRAQLDDLSRDLMTLRDEERRRMGQQLHESTGQLVAVLAMYVDLLESGKQDVNPATAQLISRSNELVQRILREVRTLSYGLYPPTLDIVGLPSALEWYVDRFVERTGMKVSFDCDRHTERLPYETELAIFRIVQDWLAAIHEHSESKSADVSLGFSPGGILLKLTLNGTPPEEMPSSGDPLDRKAREIVERVRQVSAKFEILGSGMGMALYFPVSRNGSQNLVA